MATEIQITDVKYVKELYPRIKEDERVITQYMDAIDAMPPIVIARDGILVDGFHRLQAHRRLGLTKIQAEDLGNLSDAEIFREAVKRNSTHGYQLSRDDKRNVARHYWTILAVSTPKPADRTAEISRLLSVGERTVREWTSEARAEEKKQQQDKAVDLWLDCLTQEEIAEQIGVSREAVSDWIGKFGKSAKNTEPPDSRQHFDVWSFGQTHGDANYFGALPPQVMENLLWTYTEPGDIVVDPMCGSGTTIKVAKAMGRRVWASDIEPYSPNLPIHRHDISTGWPDAPKADLIFLDPPYFKQAVGRYPKHPSQLGEVTDLDVFLAVWGDIVKQAHSAIKAGGHVAFISGPTECGDQVIDTVLEMYQVCIGAGWHPERRFIVPYNTQQATGQQVTWARENRKHLKLYRDLVVLKGE